MKKHLFLFAFLILIVSAFTVVNAEEIVTLDTVEVVMDITPSPGNADFTGTATLSDGTKKYDASFSGVSTDTCVVASFKVQPFSPGAKFTFTITSGLDSVQYYDKVYTQGTEIELQTYAYLLDGIPAYVSTFHMHAVPNTSKPVEFYRDFVPMTISPAPRYYDGVLYVPASEGAGSTGVSHIEYDLETGKITYWIFETPITLYVGSKEVSAFKNTYTLEREVITFDEIPYIPLVSFAEIVDAEVIIQDETDHINAVVFGSEAVARAIRNEEKNKAVNTLGLTSDTEYLIWVSKADYTLRVYKGSVNDWTLIKDFTCTVGKYYTPTCTGIFKYYETVDRWPYAHYYVGPIMRFNGGYAIHTTLIKYDGTPYDDRIGMNLSAGCVRLQPQDMYWLIDLIPLYTTVYVTDY